jgi:CBS domain containing-hemolysin-like protein
VSTPLLVVLAVLLLGLAALAACVQTALARLSRVAVEEVARRRPVAGLRLAELASSPRRHTAALLLARTFGELGAAACVTVAVVRYRGDGVTALAISMAVLTVAGYALLGLARGLGARYSPRVAGWAAGPVSTLARLVGPLARTLPAAAAEGALASEAELRDLVDQAEESGLVDPRERELINSVFDLGSTIVREVMVPRTEMVFIERDKGIGQALSLALRSGFSRVPVLGENEDDVVGVVYLKDLTRRHLDGGASERVDSAMRAPLFVPDSKPVDEMLREMQAARTHLAIVIDEYGGTAGLVTIEDILEEIVGEIADEYDQGPDPVEDLGDARYRVTARLPVEDLAELVGVSPSAFDYADVETVGGLLASTLGRVPIPGAVARVGNVRLEAERASGRRHRIATVLVSVEAPEPAATHFNHTAGLAAGPAAGQGPP